MYTPKIWQIMIWQDTDRYQSCIQKDRTVALKKAWHYHSYLQAGHKKNSRDALEPVPWYYWGEDTSVAAEEPARPWPPGPRTAPSAGWCERCVRPAVRLGWWEHWGSEVKWQTLKVTFRYPPFWMSMERSVRPSTVNYMISYHLQREAI